MKSSPEVSQQLLGVPFAADFHTRGKNHIKSLQRFKEQKSEWGPIEYEHISGDYGDLRFFAGDEFGAESSWGFPVRKDKAELVGTEKYFERQILKLLELKRDENTPVVMLDMGGFMGQTWMRLGKRFEKEIQDSKLVLLVSNLAYNPEEHFTKELNPVGIGRSRTQQIVDLDKSARNLVLYHVGNASTLRRTEIGTYDGKSFPLLGNVDFIFENFSLHYWSWIPELEILQSASLLSAYGSYLVKGGDYKTGSYGYVHNKNREIGIDLAHEEAMKRFDLIRVEEAEEGNMKGAKFKYNKWYFRKPDAPKFEVNWSNLNDFDKNWCAMLNGLSKS